MRTTKLQISLPPLPRWIRSHDYKPISDSEQSVELGVDEKLERDHDSRPSRLRNLRSNLAYALTPALFAKSPSPRHISATSWLDGLRGLAAFFVVFNHGSLAFYKSIRYGYGSSPKSTNPLSLPIIRLFFSGGAMVAVFFVISGYVLSTKALKLSRQGGREAEVWASISSSTFRRGPRLYIPTLTVVFLTALAAQLGLTDRLSPSPYPVSANIFQQLKIFISVSLWFITPFAPTHYFERNSWTIPIEFKGSLLVFLTCMGLARSGNRFRAWFLWGMALFWLWHGTWDLYLFSAGMAAADCRFAFCGGPVRVPTVKEGDEVLPVAVGPSTPGLVEANTNTTKAEDGVTDGQHAATPLHVAAVPPPLPSPLSLPEVPLLPPRPQPRSRPVLSTLRAILFFIILYLASPPENAELYATTPGFIWLYNLTPYWYREGFGPGRFWPAVASWLLVLLIDSSGETSVYQRVLTSRFVQYLGDISFSLYLVHGPVLHSVVSRVIRVMCVRMKVDWRHGMEGGMDMDKGGGEYLVALLVANLVGWPVLLYLSEVCTRVVDQGAVRLARRMMRW